MELTAEQNAMLERLCLIHGLGLKIVGYDWHPDSKAMAALRELLLAVQETDAKLMECGHADHGGWTRDDCPACQNADLIRAESYGDLFTEETK